ncbi:MAG: N-acetyltransferase [Bauldia sp.]|nr:N-acetyltransferase [Bauldia sp.]
MDQTITAYAVRPEQPADTPAIDALNDRVFGPGRHVRAAYRLREGVPHDPALSLVATAHGAIVGSVRLTPIAIGGRPALLLGPLCVEPAWQNRGCGKALVRGSVEAARAAGHALVLLVGDEPYYGPLGFRRIPPGKVTMPGPVDPLRLLIAELRQGAAEGLAGPVERVLPRL